MAFDVSVIDSVVRDQLDTQSFSGAVQVRVGGETVFNSAHGYANRADMIPNEISTRFATASGTKTFTAIAICQLIEAGKLTLATRLVDAVDHPFPLFDDDITIDHLLTHTSGAPDYFDEEELDASADFGDLFKDLPMYGVRSPSDLLPLFENQPMKFPPGERFAYNNGGYLLLGLVIEAVGDMPYAGFVERHVFARAGMKASGFFETDDLPRNTAYGYLDDGRTNIFSVPAKGLSDGGAFVAAPDMANFWDALFGNRLLGAEMTKSLLRPHAAEGPGDDDLHYGYGVWIAAQDDVVSGYAVSGEDPGVAFISAYFPADEVDITLLGNSVAGAWPLYYRLKQVTLNA